MSSKPIAPDSGLQQLRDEGYEVETRDQHLLVHAVPYVTSAREIKLGTLVCTYIESAGAILPPDNHQVWWTGEYPCLQDGKPIAQIENEHAEQTLFNGCTIKHRFSNKPDGVQNFTDHHSKMVHYVAHLQNQAKAIDVFADARTRRVIETRESELVFRYADTASVRAEIVAVSSRLAITKIAIVGAGGTGAYIFDQVSKTPVVEIHLFDGDDFLQHNAFRCPGAASLEEISKRMPKTEYLRQKYDPMHRGIVSHPYYLDANNVSELNGFDFVFICVDRGAARALLCKHLQAQGIPFIDVGMNIQMVKGTSKLVGTCRATLVTPQQHDHVDLYVPMQDEGDDLLYRQNIQVADMNAVNAQIAVMKWKQYFNFYADDFQAHNMTFSVNTMSLARDVAGSPQLRAA